ncbi:MAG: DNA modification methylase [Planctomycetes bacterium]|nr:DNA modification methylase [Planctomycetota bacterium]
MNSTISEPLRSLVIPLADLNLDAANARLHPEKNLAAIRSSLAQFGQRKPIVVQKKGMIVRAGNGTVLAARALGWTEIAAVVVDDDNATAAAFAIADNRTADLAEWDDEVLATLLQSMDEATRKAVGFDQVDLDQLLKDLTPEVVDDVVPEPPTNPSSKLGDLWLLGGHRLLCGDSTKAEDVHRLLAGSKPFLMVTDPPYGVEYDPEWRHETGLNNSDRTGRVANDDRVDWTDAYNLFPGTVAYVWHAGRFAADLVVNLRDAKFEVRTQIIWRKPRFAISRGHYHWQHEPCWYAVRPGASAKWCGDRSQSTIWDIDYKGQDADTVHGTQKPLECMARPVRNHGGAGDDVYDPFLGSGTTLIACEQIGRKCFGLELDPRYVDVIVQRWEKATGREATLDGDGRTFAVIKAERSGIPLPQNGKPES